MSEVAQSCPTLCDPVDCSLPGSSVHGIFQARILEWVAISFSRRSPNPETEPGSPALQADSLLSEPPGKPELTSIGSEMRSNYLILCFRFLLNTQNSLTSRARVYRGLTESQNRYLQEGLFCIWVRVKAYWLTFLLFKSEVPSFSW